MYYVLRNDNFDQKEYYYFKGELFNTKKNIVGTIFDDGEVHKNMEDPYLLILDETESIIERRKETDFITSFVKDSGSILVISPNAINCLRKWAPGDFEVYDLTVRGSNFILETHKVLKVINKIDCVNLKLSDLRYSERTDSIKMVKKLVLNMENIPTGKQIFLLGKRKTGIIMVHEELKNNIEAANLTGVKFHDLDKLRGVVI